MRIISIFAVLCLAGTALAGCDASPTAGSDTVLTATQLKYRLLDRYALFYCDPDYWPIVRGDEQERALVRFPAIAADAEKLDAILAHLGLAGRSDFTAEEKLRIYREDKRLAAITLEASGSEYRFELRASEQQNVFAVSGGIDTFGSIIERERSVTVGTCPICLSGETRIAAEHGSVRVSELAQGTRVWSVDEAGHRVLVHVQLTTMVAIPLGHGFMRIRLADGREFEASPGHPTADGRRLSDLAVGDMLDGSRVVDVSRVRAHGEATWDLLPASATGVYWANDVLLGSTLSGSTQVHLQSSARVPLNAKPAQ